MNIDITSKNDILTDLNITLAADKAKLAAWKAVERQTKKDTSDFKVFSKNFKNADIGVSFSDHSEIRVFYSYDYIDGYGNKRYTSNTDSIDLRHCVEDWCRAGHEKPDDSRILKVSYLRDYFFNNVDETFMLIAERISYLKRHISETERLLTIYENVVDTFVDTVHNAIKEVADKTGSSDNGLYYDCIELLQHGYWYH